MKLSSENHVDPRCSGAKCGAFYCCGRLIVIYIQMVSYSPWILSGL